MPKQKLPIDSLADNDVGADTIRRFSYQHVYGAILLLEAVRGEAEGFEALWCEQQEDLLCQFKGDRFDYYQVKTQVETSGQWQMGDKKIENSIRRFVEMEQKFGDTTHHYIFVSNCPFMEIDKASPNAKSKISPIKFVEAFRTASCINDVPECYRGEFNKLNESPGTDEEVLIKTLSKTYFRKGPTLEAIESELINDHLSKVEGCSDLSFSSLKELQGRLDLLISKASSKRADSPRKHLINLSSAKEKAPYLLNKKVTVEDFNKLLSAYMTATIPLGMREELNELLKEADLPDELCEDQFISCINAISPSPPTRPEIDIGLQAQIDFLLDTYGLLYEANIKMPVLWFIWALIPYATASSQQALKKWFKGAEARVISVLGDGKPLVLPSEETMPSAPKQPAYLLVELTEVEKKSEVNNEAQQYDLRIWLLDGNGKQDEIETQSGVNLGQVSSIVASLRKDRRVEFARQSSQCKLLYIEFIVSNELMLTLDPAQLEIIQEKPTGFYCPVTVRSYERLIGEMDRAGWESCWDENHQKLTLSPATDHLLPVECPIDFILSEKICDGVLAFGLFFAPDCDFIDEVIDTGGAIMLWSSKQQTLEQLGEEIAVLKGILEKKSNVLHGLPEALYHYRRNIWSRSNKNGLADKAAHLGSFQLLWDDPTRDPYEHEYGLQCP